MTDKKYKLSVFENFKSLIHALIVFIFIGGLATLFFYLLHSWTNFRFTF